MHFKLAILALVAAELGTVTAAPHQFEKRVVRVDRVPAGPRNRNALNSMRFALKKYGYEVPASLADADATLWAGSKYNSKCQQSGPSSHPANESPASAPMAGDGGNNPATGPATSDVAADRPGRDGYGDDDGSRSGNVTNHSVGEDIEYISEVTVGGQRLMMNFDTGSSDLWVFSTEMPEEMRPEPHVAFDKSKSDTFKLISGASFSVKFGDGSSTQGSTVGTDTVQIGGVTAEEQTIELAHQVASQFVKDTNSNGLVGLAFSSINNVQPKAAKTFFDNIKDQLAEPILAADLRKNAPGSYTFGKVDHTAFTGRLNFIPVDNSKGFWQFPSTKFAVGDGPVQVNQGANPAIADTGTTLMLVDENVARRYYKDIPGATSDADTGMYVFPCNAKLPDFHVATGDNMVTIPGPLIKFQTLKQQTGGSKKRSGSRRDLIIELGPGQSSGGAGTGQRGAGQQGQQGQLGRPGQQGQQGQPSQQGQQCVGGIQGNKGSQIQIYGDIFFKAQYTVFNIGNNTIGFAPHA